jgi:hypothetical protein
MHAASAGVFHEAYTKEFYVRENGTEHIREIHIAGKVHNNKMERMNGEIRDRERVMRTLEIPDTPILTGMQIYHNYTQLHTPTRSPERKNTRRTRRHSGSWRE